MQYANNVREASVKEKSKSPDMKPKASRIPRPKPKPKIDRSKEYAKQVQQEMKKYWAEHRDNYKPRQAVKPNKQKASKILNSDSVKPISPRDSLISCVGKIKNPFVRKTDPSSSSLQNAIEQISNMSLVIKESQDKINTLNEKISSLEPCEESDGGDSFDSFWTDSEGTGEYGYA